MFLKAMFLKAMFLKLNSLTIIFLIGTSAVLAESPCSSEHRHHGHFMTVQTHAGQMDTDGILSAGEIPNPNINYDKAQRHGIDRGDQRYNNPFNDNAANKENALRDQDRKRYEWEHSRRNHDDKDWDRRDSGRDNRYESEHGRERENGWRNEWDKPKQENNNDQHDYRQDHHDSRWHW